MDSETGGLDSSKHSILTLYMAAYDDNLNHIGDLDLKIKPENGKYNVTEEALKINGIELISHDKLAMTESDATIQIEQFLMLSSRDGADKLVVIGHNATFDVNFITAQLVPVKTWEKYVHRNLLDTMTIAFFLKCLRIVPMNVPNSLSSLSEFFCIKTANLHDAKSDSLVTISLLKKMIKEVKGLNPR